MTAFRGNADWTGYDMISGHWYSGPGQVDVPTNFLTVTGKAVGDTVTFNFDAHRSRPGSWGEVFDTDNRARYADRLANARRHGPRPHFRHV